MSNTTSKTQSNEAQATAVNFRNDSRRAFAFNLFTSLLPQRAELGNTEFRKQVLVGMEKEFNMTRASASATYNVVKKLAVEQELCEDFGRTPAAPKPAKEPKARKTGSKAAAKTVNVVRAKDQKVVAEGISIAEAQELVAKAAKQKKAKLEIA